MGRRLRLVRRRRDGIYYYVYAGREVPLAEANRALFFGGEEGAATAERWAELLDEDLARFHEVVSVAEELAERVFRGEYRTSIEIWTPGLAGEYSSTKIYCHILLGSRDSGRAAARLMLAFDGSIFPDYGEDDPWGEGEAFAADYTATMEIRLERDAMPAEGPDILVESFVRELAGILGEPDMARALLEGDPWTLYDRSLRVDEMGAG